MLSEEGAKRNQERLARQTGVGRRHKNEVVIAGPAI